MNILGIGGPELILILLLMLIIAGPKRMLQWSYVMGKWVAKFRVMWSQTVDMVQKEFDAAGVDVKLPKTPPTRKSLTKMVEDAVAPANDPLRKTLDDVKADINQIDEDINQATFTTYTSKKVANLSSKKASAETPKTPAEQVSASAMSTWAGSGVQAKNGAGGSQNGSATTTASPPSEANFGSWSGTASKPSDAPTPSERASDDEGNEGSAS